MQATIKKIELQAPSPKHHIQTPEHKELKREAPNPKA